MIPIRSVHLLVLATLVALSSACSEPPGAPSDYEELLAYVFEHAGDEDDEALAAGLENLHAWLQESSRLESVLEGYVIDALPESAVANLDSQSRTAAGARLTGQRHQAGRPTSSHETGN